MVDQGAVGMAGRPASRAAATRQVRDVGAHVTHQAAVGPVSSGATDHSTGPRLYGHRRSQIPRPGGRAGAARAVGRRGGARLGEPVGALWARLTDRDRRILALVAEHRVLTTEQLTVLAFGSRPRAQHRLHELHGMDVVWRFRFPRAAGGSYPWHYALGYTGARLIAAQKAVRPPRPAEHAQHLERLVESPTLRHQLGVNDFFVALAAYACRQQGWPNANTYDGTGLDTWHGEAEITAFHADTVRPDGFGAWSEHGRLTRFYLEYDTGSETLARVAGKLEDYHAAARRAGGPLTGPVLFTVATTRREAGLRAALARSLAHVEGLVAVATTARDYGHPDGPAGPVWAPLTRAPDAVRRARLPDLPDTTVQHKEPAGGGGTLALTGWMDDDPAEMIILEDPDESWSA